MSDHLRQDFLLTMSDLDPMGLNKLRGEGTLDDHAEMVAEQAQTLLNQTLPGLLEGPARC